MVNETCKVLEHVDIGAGYRYLVLEAPQIVAAAQPGQFVHVKVPTLEMSALRRPFSIFNAEEGKLELLYKTVGRGTAALNAAKVGETLEVMGPLGHGFPMTCSGTPLLVGGGFGVAPLYFLARMLLKNGAATPNPPPTNSGAPEQVVGKPWPSGPITSSVSPTFAALSAAVPRPTVL